jgi:RNA polymerase sigma-70 factor (ECF subfamily)
METYRPRLRRTALRLVHNETDADDIVQEAFMRWFTAPPRDTAYPEAWLTTVVRRLCVDAHRAKKKEHLYDAQDIGRFAAHKIVDFNRALEREDEFAIVLERLSERATAEECLALLLREGFGYGYADIASIMDKTEDACRQLVHRGKCAAQGMRAQRRPAAAIPAQTVAAFTAALRQCDIGAAVSIFGYLTGGATATAPRRKCVSTY